MIVRPRIFGAAVAVMAAASAVPVGAREPAVPGRVAAIRATPERNLSDAKPGAGDAAAARAPERGELSVTVDRAKVIRLPERTQTVVIGNPAIADISLQKSGVVVLTGKSFGVTNFIALDGTGTMLAESMVSVTAPSDGTMIVQRGFDRQTYSCNPRCQPSVALGDAVPYFAEVKGQVEQHGQFSTR